jgi:hypothetical protein
MNSGMPPPLILLYPVRALTASIVILPSKLELPVEC